MDNISTVLVNDLINQPHNSNVAYNNSWLNVNGASFPLFAQASYITNLDDLTISLSASHIQLGDLNIADGVTYLNATVNPIRIGYNGLRTISTLADPNSDIFANIVNLGGGIGALRVLSQDLTATADSVAIGDHLGNYATITGGSLNVNLTNPTTAVTILNPVSTFDIVACNVTLPVSGNISITNQLTGITILNPVTAVSVNNLNTYISGLTSIIATANNQVLTNTLLNYLTSIAATQITLENTLTANSVYGTNVNQPLYATITSPVSNILVNSALPITFADSVQIDQASRLRVATPQTQWWYMATVDKDGDLRYNESFVGGASSIFVQNLASVNLTSGTTSVSGQVIRASRRRHKIIPGLSHEYTGVFNWDGQQANVLKRIGIFTQFNGYFFELSGTNAMNAVVRRRLPDGSLVEERVNQTAWNGDKLDGTGPSGENWNALTQTAAIIGWVSTTPIAIQNDGNVYNVVYTLSAGQVQNFRQGTKATITGITPSTYNAIATISNTDTATNRLTATYLYNPGVSASNASAGSMVQTGYHMQHTYWIDFMGGRTNRIRFGKSSDYGKIVLHTFRFDGLLGTAYENAPTLTERKEVSNFGSVTTLPSFTVMGNAFNIEAAVDITPNFNMARNDAGVAFTTEGVSEYPLLGLALRAGEPYQRADIQLQNLYITDTANLKSNNDKAAFSWRIVLNPSIQGTLPTPTNIGKASRQWAYTTANSVSGGIDLIGGYGISQLAESFPTALNFINMGSNIDNTDSDKIVVVAKLINKGTDPSSLYATMNFVEAL